jgi:hypothetical protein
MAAPSHPTAPPHPAPPHPAAPPPTAPLHPTAPAETAAPPHPAAARPTGATSHGDGSGAGVMAVSETWWDDAADPGSAGVMRVASIAGDSVVPLGRRSRWKADGAVLREAAEFALVDAPAN